MPKLRILIVMSVILGTGLVLLVSNAGLPIVRNSLVYANVSLNIIEHGFNPLPVIADTNLSFGKPMAFSFLSAPFVSALGVNIGLKTTSFLGAAFFLCTAYFFFVRLNRRIGIEARFIPLELALLFFNPLVFYQFWSAYPDGLFAGEVLLAFVLTDVIVIEHKRDTRPLILLLGIVIYAAILTKYYGMILCIACPAYIFLHSRLFFKQSSYVVSKSALLAGVFYGLGAVIVLAMQGRNPTLNFAADMRIGGGYSEYMSALTNMSLGMMSNALITLIFALVLNFNFILFFSLKRYGNPKRYAAPVCFGGLFLLGLLPFPATYYNMRLFLPLFPFVVVVLANGIQVMNKGALRKGLLIAYVSVTGFLILNYNVGPLYEALLPLNEKIEQVVNKDLRLDNLRINQHLELLKKIDQINRVIGPGDRLYWVSAYYGTATQGVIERLGIRSDIEVQYIRKRNSPITTEKTAYITEYRCPWFRFVLRRLSGRFTVSFLGEGTFRLVPLRATIKISGPKKNSLFDVGETVLLKANVSTPPEVKGLKVGFFMDGIPIAINKRPPYEFRWYDAKKGRHVAMASTRDDKGNTALSVPVVFFTGMLAQEISIVRPSDDAEEIIDNGRMFINSYDLELANDEKGNGGDQIVGMRFENIQVPKNLPIKKAYIQFTANGVNTRKTDLEIYVEQTYNPRSFAPFPYDISTRKLTSTSVKWTPGPWNIIDERSEKQRTPDISSLIQEVFDQSGWQKGNALVFIIRGTGKRSAISYDGEKNRAPMLYVEYTYNANDRSAPVMTK